MLTNLESRTIFAARFREADIRHPGGVVPLPLLVALILLMRTNSKVAQAIVQRVQIDMIDFIAFGDIYQMTMQLFSVSVHHVKDFSRQITIIAIKADSGDLIQR